MRNIFIQQIIDATSQTNSFQILEDKFINLSRKNLSDNLIQFGVLPEVFDHDSSEEKNWAKLSDIILACALNHLGCRSDVLRTRGDSADVFGKCENYSLVADAKTFRLSRTAKNQKDFKVKALDDWRKENTFAFLASPLSQYPTGSSQIYAQGIDRNITFLSYLHLKILLDYNVNSKELIKLFQTGNRLKATNPKDPKSALNYWKEINKTVCELAGITYEKLEEYKNLEIETTKKLGDEGIGYWEGKIAEFKLLSRDEAISKLIKSHKIESKIVTIQRSINCKIILI